MTIEQIIKYLPAPICGDTVIGKEKQKEYDAHDSAIIILRKYQKIQTRLDRLEHGMECLLESDPRTFTNRECENGWIFDRIIEWRKVIREVLEDGNENNHYASNS